VTPRDNPRGSGRTKPGRRIALRSPLALDEVVVNATKGKPKEVSGEISCVAVWYDAEENTGCVSGAI